MNRLIIGAVVALLMVAAGLFWWQGRAAVQAAAPPAATIAEDAGAIPDEIPTEDGEGQVGPDLPAADPATREERRFNRLDRNRDNAISRAEMLAPRVAAFRKLDTDHNNLLSFEEWSVLTTNRFKAADANGDAMLSRQEFVATRPKPAARPVCRCDR